MTSDITQRIFELAAEHSQIPVDQITREHSFVSDLNFDSLESVEFAMDVEDEFEISLPDEEIQNFRTVGDMIDYLQKHQVSASPATA
jgi:acyl carrier protein